MNTLHSALKRLWIVATMPDYVMGFAPVPGVEKAACVVPASATLPRATTLKSSGH